MINKSVRNTNVVKKMKEIFFATVAVIGGGLVSNQWFDQSLGWHCGITLVIMLVTVPLDIWIDKKIDESIMDKLGRS